MRKPHWILLAGAVLLLAGMACNLSSLMPTEEPQPTVAPTVAQEPTEEPEPTQAEPTPEPTPEPTDEPSATPVPKVDPTNLSLTLVNASGVDIWYVYLSPTKSDEWGEDQLGDDLILDGETYTIENVSSGVYDLRAEGRDGEPIEVVLEMDVEEDVSLTITGMAALEVFNESGDTITYLYISLTESDTWGEDWLGPDVIGPGSSYVVSGIPSGSYDIQAADDTDTAIESVYSVDLAGDMTWTVVGKTDLPDNAVLRFEDDFSDNRNDWGFDTEGEDVNYMRPSGGEYCMLIKTENWTAWEWYEPFRTDEFVAEVACTLTGAVDASCGLGFGPDGDNLYWFEVSPFDQTYALFLLEDGSWQENLVDWTLSKNIDPGRSNYLSMERVEGVVSLFVNGVLLDRVESARFPTGRLGIGGSTYEEDNGTVCLDNLRVWRLE